MSILILERLIGTLPATPPTIEDLSQFLLSTLEKVPVTSQVFQSLNRDVGGTDYVRVCTEQETVSTAKSRRCTLLPRCPCDVQERGFCYCMCQIGAN
jgi:hypothetical protein